MAISKEDMNEMLTAANKVEQAKEEKKLADFLKQKTTYTQSQIISEAQKEYEQEKFREEVEKHKTILRLKKSFWSKIFPYRIILVKRIKHV